MILKRCIAFGFRRLKSTLAALPLPAHQAQPLRLELPLSGEKLFVDQLTTDQHDDAFSLVCDAARRADNIGLDEYPTLEHWKNVVDSSSVSLRLSTDNTTTNKLDALILISPSRYCRSTHPTLCSALLVTSAQLSRRLVWRDLITVALDAARQLPNRFSACVVDVFISCLDRIAALRDQGFLVTACVPNAGKLATYRHGHLANYIMYKPITEAPLASEMSQQPPQSSTLSTSSNFMPNMVPTNNFPARFTFSDGTRVILRSMQPTDVRPFYEGVMSAVEDGLGYGVDEIPSYEFFVRNYIHNFQNMTTVLEETGEVVSYANVGPTTFSRSASPVIVDCGNIVVNRKFRRNKWFVDNTYAIYDGFERSNTAVVGYQGDTVLDNIVAVVGGQHIGLEVNGVVPRAIYVKDKGWADLVLYYRPIPGKLPNRAVRTG